MGIRDVSLAAVLLCMSLPDVARAGEGVQTFRLYEGIAVLVPNDQGRDFAVDLDLYDLNLLSSGPREVLYKIYDPDDRCVVREFIPDDGVAGVNYLERTAGWDSELEYYVSLYAKGTMPSYRWSAWSDPNRLAGLAKRTFRHSLKGAKGVWRIVLAGTPDNYVTLRLSPDMKYGVAGHPAWTHGHGDMYAKSYIYVPKGTSGVYFQAAEMDLPATRHFKLTAPDGKVLFDGAAVGGYVTSSGAWDKTGIDFPQPGAYDGKLLTLEVSPGAGDFMFKVTLQQPPEGPFKEYVGMGSIAVAAPDEATAMAIKGGTTVVDDLVFWHGFQVRFHQWLKSHNLDGSESDKALKAQLLPLFDAFRLLENSDGRGTYTFRTNWAYAMGYYGCKIWRPSWLLMQRADVPADLKEIIREGLIIAGDRLSFATGIERSNGNAFSQINVALWYSQQATGDKLQKERFEVFWQRWKTEGWGRGCGLSPSGDSQEFLGHDMHYGSYLMDNWRGGTWVKEGIVPDANTVGDGRFAEVLERYRELYSYLYCREAKGQAIPANPWSLRTFMSAHHGEDNWKLDGRTWKGEPGPDFTVNVNGGNEWFAARRKGYYALTYHGRIGPEWECRSQQGQLGFGGGIICQLTVPGKGPVMASTLHDSYGNGMHPSNWRNFHLHSLVGLTWDDRPLVTAISEHENARLAGNVLTSSGEVRDAHVKVTRSYTFGPDGIDCAAGLAESDYGRVLSIWSHERQWSQVKEAYEMIPFLPKDPTGKKPTSVTLLDASGKTIGPAMAQATESTTVSAAAALAKTVRIDRGGFGVEIQLDQPRKVVLGKDTILIQIVEPAEKAVAADKVAIKYRLVPFGE